ncbi:hypothetical protein MSG_04128 [Mycobacterium shigaense]|uniref:Uncharacterized protein n=1 Tax=Mycobacterium shigaense TaxID=722731 RepID=A0A1Z4EMN7_9MYCO|nr:hypothetical protein B2J96_23515 [Mycobacterium shigaense]BAX94249.1 hypothetical protein MSG_04128 [Mycobacterium shigaense]
MGGGDVEALRWRLLDRLDEHPMEEWSAPLLRAVIDVIDLSGEAVPAPLLAGRPSLRVIR